MHKISELENYLLPSPRMPVLFVGHGNPMHAISDNDITQTWSKIGTLLPAAQAIIVISAHWLTSGSTHITDAPKQPILYDMYGFPDELYKVTYHADGDPTIAKILEQSFRRYEAKLDSGWGLDHGTWSILKFIAPHPQVPILQISLDMELTLNELSEQFRDLKKLREKGVIFIGSGNLVHNLRLLNFEDEKIFDWALEFDDLAGKHMRDKNLKKLTNPSSISSASSLAVQFDDHYRPMIAAMSLLHEDENIEFFNEVIDMGSISMRSFITN